MRLAAGALVAAIIAALAWQYRLLQEARPLETVSSLGYAGFNLLYSGLVWFSGMALIEKFQRKTNALRTLPRTSLEIVVTVVAVVRLVFWREARQAANLESVGPIVVVSVLAILSLGFVRSRIADLADRTWTMQPFQRGDALALGIEAIMSIAVFVALVWATIYLI